jgi:hypothetical protein
MQAKPYIKYACYRGELWARDYSEVFVANADQFETRSLYFTH